MLLTELKMANTNDKDDKFKTVIVRKPVDLQRLKLDKLMKHPDKPVLIPEKPKERGMLGVPDFVRNVMGSSAGAGSGEFHVYRHLRRKEYARQHYMNEKARWDNLEKEYHDKLEENKRKAEEATEKRRAKRLKKKQKYKKKTTIVTNKESEESEIESDDCQDLDEILVSQKHSPVSNQVSKIPNETGSNDEPINRIQCTLNELPNNTDDAVKTTNSTAHSS